MSQVKPQMHFYSQSNQFFDHKLQFICSLNFHLEWRTHCLVTTSCYNLVWHSKLQWKKGLHIRPATEVFMKPFSFSYCAYTAKKDAVFTESQWAKPPVETIGHHYYSSSLTKRKIGFISVVWRVFDNSPYNQYSFGSVSSSLLMIIKIIGNRKILLRLKSLYHKYPRWQRRYSCSSAMINPLLKLCKLLLLVQLESVHCLYSASYCSLVGILQMLWM